MANSINDEYNSDSTLLEADLSDLDSFDFLLDEDADGEQLFNASSDEDFNGIIADLSAGMDLEFEAPKCCHAVEDREEDIRLATNSVDCHSRRGKRERSPSPHPHEHQQFQMNTVDFDHHEQQQHMKRPRRVVSYSDLSVCSAESSSTLSANQQVSEPATIYQYSQDKYSEKLQRLAESMKRTQMTRCHVRLHRSMLGPEEQRALYLAKERLNQLSRQMQSMYQTPQIQQQSSTPEMIHFFKSSAQGSFVNKMEESRKSGRRLKCTWVK